MKGLCAQPWWVRFYRRYLETPRRKKRRRARDHKEFRQRLLNYRLSAALDRSEGGQRKSPQRKPGAHLSLVPKD
jgi:hypothetical protein